MSYEVIIKRDVTKYLKNLEKGQKKDKEKIIFFIENILRFSDNPCILKNARKLVGFSDNRFRWRLNDYRIIGIVNNTEFRIIQIIKISKRDERTYKDL